jgi:hypothetical protein
MIVNRGIIAPVLYRNVENGNWVGRHPLQFRLSDAYILLAWLELQALTHYSRY